MTSNTTIMMITVLFLSFLSGACGGGGDSKSSDSPTTQTDGGSDNNNNGSDTENSAYTAGIAASTSTIEESTELTSELGEAADLSLGDGTTVSIPGLPESYSASLRKASLTDSEAVKNISGILADDNLIPTGAVRSLSISGSGDPATLVVNLTIPGSDIGSINPATINVLRIADSYIDGEKVEDYAMTLTAILDASGDLQITDPYLRDAIEPFSSSDVNNLNGPSNAESAKRDNRDSSGNSSWQVDAQYVLITFQGNLNWNRTPELIRMVPQPNDAASGYRRPATSSELTTLAKQPICNLVLLVHGHNEEEKGGTSSDTSAPEPWRVGYKQLVWDLFYQQITSGDYPYACTAFYEYIYPTYRPIFSQVVDASGTEHETLGDALGVLMQQELVSNPQLKAMIQNDMRFNAMVVAHSQGGLVARAGLRQMPQEFLDSMTRFVSWGSPHRGAPLYTLRYAFESGRDMYVDGTRLPFQAINNAPYFGSRYRDQLNAHVAIDAPGIRDLRWDNALQNQLRFSTLFPELSSPLLPPIKIPLYSQNLTAFNADTSRETIPGGYTFIVGNTSKRVDLSYNDVFEAWYFISGSTSIEQGATLNASLMADGENTANDGAVPLLSQSAEGVSFQHETRVLNLGDIDHEEFYGAEPAQRTAEALERGRLTARTTFTEGGLSEPGKQCPTIEDAIATPDDDNTHINGTLSFALYDTAQGGDGLLGQRIDQITLRNNNQQGSQITGFTFNAQNDGRFTVSGNTDSLPDGDIVVVVTMKDGSEISAPVQRSSVTIQPPRIIVYELQGGATEVTDTYSASVQPAGEYRYEWQLGDGTVVSQTPTAGENSSVTHTFTGLSDGDEWFPTVKVYQLSGELVGQDNIAVSVTVAEAGLWVREAITSHESCSTSQVDPALYSYSFREGHWQFSDDYSQGSGTYSVPPESLQPGQTFNMAASLSASGTNAGCFYSTSLKVTFGNGDTELFFSIPNGSTEIGASFGVECQANGDTSATGSVIVPDPEDCNGEGRSCNAIIIRGTGAGPACGFSYSYHYKYR